MGTYYVDMDATGSNNGTSWANAWTSIQSALNAINTWGAGPHTVKVKRPSERSDAYIDDGSGTGLSVLYPVHSGAQGQPIIFEGLARDGVTPDMVPVYAYATAACLTDTGLSGPAWYVFKNFDFSYGMHDVLLGRSGNITFKSCWFNYAAMFGLYSTVPNLRFEKCLFLQNGTDALYLEADVEVIGCQFSMGGTWGCKTTAGGLFDRCVFNYNAIGDLQADHAIVNACTFFNVIDEYPDSIAVNITGADGILTMVNTIVTGHGTGVQTPTNLSESLLSCHNAIAGNTVDYVNFATHNHAVTGDLKLIGYTPKADSPCVNAGLDAHSGAINKPSYADIGAVEALTDRKGSVLICPYTSHQIRRLP